MAQDKVVLPRYCTNCFYYVSKDNNCTYKNNLRTNMSTGLVEYISTIDQKRKAIGDCGQEGKYYIEKNK